MFNKIYLPCLFGVESVLAQELKDMGYAQSQIEVKDALVCLHLTEAEDLADQVARLNINLRTAERVLVGLSQGLAENFDQLYELVKAIAWPQVLDPGYVIEVKGYSRQSKLNSLPACQRIIKKAIVDRMLEAGPGQKLKRGKKGPRGEQVRLAENPRKGINRIQFSLVKDHLQVYLETSGDPLHKRGYRPLNHAAPLRESLAAAILAISFYRKNIANREVLWDPFCGSGTFPIEAALIATRTAPGLGREFAAEKYKMIGQASFTRQRQLAREQSLLYGAGLKSVMEQPKEPGQTHLNGAASGLRRNSLAGRQDFLLAGQDPRIFASDISEEALAMTRDHARRAGVSDLIEVFQADIHQLNLPDLVRKFASDRILLCGNPPYGERLESPAEARAIERSLAVLCFNPSHELKPGLRLSLISSDNQLEREFGRRADRRRKLYNGGLKCTLYHYFKSPRPRDRR